MKLLSHVRLFATPWTVAYKPPPPMRFSRQEYWSGLPFPSPGDLPNPGIEPRSPTLQADALPSEPPGDMRELQYIFLSYVNKDLIFLGHFSCHWIIAIGDYLKNFPKGFPGGCGNLEWAIHILAQTVCTRCLCTQTKPMNQTESEFHQPGVTLQTKQKAKRCPKIKSQVARVPHKDGKAMP